MKSWREEKGKETWFLPEWQLAPHSWHQGTPLYNLCPAVLCWCAQRLITDRLQGQGAELILLCVLRKEGFLQLLLYLQEGLQLVAGVGRHPYHMCSMCVY